MMSATTSATTGRRYGLERVCRTWERSRSALYARRARAQCRKRGAGLARRGPTPALSDAQLLAAIRTDLARSPFQGEGHRKVHARLRILDWIRVSRTRVPPQLVLHRQFPNVSLGGIQHCGYRFTGLLLQPEFETGHRPRLPRLQPIDLHPDCTRARVE